MNCNARKCSEHMEHCRNYLFPIILFISFSLLIFFLRTEPSSATEISASHQGGVSSESAQEPEEEEIDVDSFIMFALLQRYFGYRKDAVNQLELITKAFPTNLEANLYLGIMHEAEGRYLSAFKAYERIMQTVPESIIGYVFAGNLLLKAAEEAMEAEDDEVDSDLFLDRAEAYLTTASEIDGESAMVAEGLERCESLKKERREKENAAPDGTEEDNTGDGDGTGDGSLS